MATNTGEDFRIGSVKNRLQVCNVKSGVCKKIDTTTNQVIDQKDGKYKGIADHTDKRRDEFFNSEVDKKHS